MNINKLTIPANYVLVKPHDDFKTFIINGRDTGIWVGDAADAKDFSADSAEHGDTATTEGQRKAVTGTVVKVCNKLIYNGDILQKKRQGFSNEMSYMGELSRLRAESVTFDVPIEVKEGDNVIFDYVAHYECYQTGQYIETEDGDYFFMKYDQLYAKYNDQNKIYPLNGRIFVEAIEREEQETVGDIVLVKITDRTNFDADKYLKGKKLQIAKVLNIGCVCKGYLDYPEIGDDRYPIEQGDYVAFKWAYASPFQHEMHQKFYPNKKVLVLNRKDLVLYIQNEQVLKQLKIA